MQKPTLDRFPKKVLARIDIQSAFIVSRLIVACERLQLFRAFAAKPLAAEAIGRKLHLHPLYRQPLLNTLVSLGLLRKAGETFALTPFARKYFVEERSIHWTRLYSTECVEQYEALTVLEEALVSGKRYEAIRHRDKPSFVDRMTRDQPYAAEFTQMLFHLHQGEAEALADYLDLSRHTALLDVAGGSGVMSIALARKNPHLRATVLDVAPACAAARNIRRAGLSARVRTLPGDMRRPLRAGYDAILIADVGTIPRALLDNAWRALPPAGLLVLADRFLSDDGTQPLDRVAIFFADPGFGLATRREMVDALKASGFRSVKARQAYADVWFLTAVKPGARATVT